MDGKNRGLTLVDHIVIIVVVLVIGVFGVVVFRNLPHGCGPTACKNNLSQLWKMQQVYASQYGGSMPTETGKAFWLKLRDVRLVEGDDIFNCPTRGEPSRDCQYRGPGVSVGKLKDDGIVGADDAQNHDGEGGNVLRKSGDVTEVFEQHEFEDLTAELQ